MASTFMQVMAVLADPHLPVSSLSTPLCRLMPVEGASISTLGATLPSLTLSASDEVAARVDELQFDLGEGPCWDAIAHVAPVLVPDVAGAESPQWPAFSEAIVREGVAALFAFPCRSGRSGSEPSTSTPGRRCGSRGSRISQMSTLSDALGRRVLLQTLTDSERTDDDIETAPTDPYSRRLIHQATGAVLAQLPISPDDAHLLIQGRAFATRRSMAEVADDLLEKRIVFRQTDSGTIVEEARDD